MKTAAVILAGGSGKRMGADVPKQYMLLDGKPLIYYALKCFQESFIDEMVLVCAAGQEAYCRREIAARFGFDKLSAIVCGGKERYHSVFCGIQAVAEDAAYIFIHDGARAFITEDVLERGLKDVKRYKASVAAMPARDTIKLADDGALVRDTPNRKGVWLAQTPQIFEAGLIRKAYEGLLEREEELLSAGVEISDDAMVVEHMTDERVHLFFGDAKNIKLTTPEDMEYAEWILTKRSAASGI